MGIDKELKSVLVIIKDTKKSMFERLEIDDKFIARIISVLEKIKGNVKEAREEIEEFIETIMISPNIYEKIVSVTIELDLLISALKGENN
jgi:hypothetical protein